MVTIEESVNQAVSISPEVMNLFLEPYTPECRYLQSASWSDIGEGAGGKRKYAATGKFSIPSCYYAANRNGGPTHFNATDFILCFNQLEYVFFGDMARLKLIPELKANSLEEFKEAMMERSLIVKFYDITFRKPIDPSDFTGRVSIDRIRKMGPTGLCEARSEFRDGKDGYAEGKSLIAFREKACTD